MNHTLLTIHNFAKANFSEEMDAFLQLFRQPEKSIQSHNTSDTVCTINFMEALGSITVQNVIKLHHQLIWH